MTSAPTFTVSMHTKLVDELDEQLSPFDGIVAIDEIFLQLPIIHEQRHGSRVTRRRRKWLKLHRGRFGWVDIGFSYVQIGKQLHVVELWTDEDWSRPNRSEVDCVLGTRTESRGHI